MIGISRSFLVFLCVVTGAVFVFAELPNYVATVEHDVSDTGDQTYNLETTVYTDGLSRTIQTVQKVNGTDGSVVSSAEYDALGRTEKVIRPFYINETGYIEGSLIGKANNYYKDHGDPSSGLTQKELKKRLLPDAGGYPYSRTVYYEDQLNRVKAQIPMGAESHNNSARHVRYWYFGTVIGSPNDFIDNKGFIFKGKLDVATLDGLTGLGVSDPKHFLTIVKDENSSYSQQITDAFGNTIATWSQTGTGPIVSKYTYSITNQVLTEDPPEINVKNSWYRYSTSGNVLQKYTPDGGRVDFFFDDASRLEYSVSPNERESDSVIYFCYDIFGRTTEIRKVAKSDVSKARKGEAVGRLLVKKFYDKKEKLIQFIRSNVPRKYANFITNMVIGNSRGRIVGEVAFDSDERNPVIDAVSYDFRGQIATKYKFVPGVAPMYTTYLYDRHGKVTRERIQIAGTGSFLRKYHYNSQGRLSYIEEDDGSGLPTRDSEKLIAFDYYPTNELFEKNFAGTGHRNHRANYAYTIRNWAKYIGSNVRNGTPWQNGLFEEELEYESAGQYNGNIGKSSFSYGLPDKVANMQFSYVYDKSNRLTSVGKSGSDDILPEMEEQFIYDKNGRLHTKKRGTDSETKHNYRYAYEPGTNRLSALERTKDGVQRSQAYFYDPNGNCILDESKRLITIHDWRDLPVAFVFVNDIPPEFYVDNDHCTKDDNRRVIRGDILKALEAKGARVLSRVDCLYDASGNRVFKMEYNN